MYHDKGKGIIHLHCLNYIIINASLHTSNLMCERASIDIFSETAWLDVDSWTLLWLLSIFYSYREVQIKLHRMNLKSLHEPSIHKFPMPGPGKKGLDFGFVPC